ncbi:MAG: hypothetical protein JWN30_2832 [Bacilli bacterium]|nr:hypothetical protein [Bacilli bacterium]
MNKMVDGSIPGLMLRVIIVYFVVLLAMRLMGKREIGKLSVFDLVISIMIAEVSAVALEKPDAPLPRGILIIAGLVLLQIMMSFVSLKSKLTRGIVDGHSTLLISGGQINEREMRRTRYSLSDLMIQLREKDIFSVADVEFAILETTGKLSVIPKAEKRPLTPSDLNLSVPRSTLPVPLIIEGKPIEQSLRRLNKSRSWLTEQVETNGYQKIDDVFYCCIDGTGKLYFDAFDQQELAGVNNITQDL